MSEFTQKEIEDIIEIMTKSPPEKEAKIPLKPPGNYQSIAKIAFSPLEGEKPRPLSQVTEKEVAEWGHLKAHVEIFYGKTKLRLKELAALKEGSLIPFEDLCDDLVDIYVNGTKVARGEVVGVDGQFGVKIVSFLS